MANIDAQTRILCSPDPDARDVQMPHMHHASCTMPHEPCPLCPSCIMPPCTMSPASKCPPCQHVHIAQSTIAILPHGCHTCHSALLHQCPIIAHVPSCPRRPVAPYLLPPCSMHQAPMPTCVPSHAHMPRAPPSHATCGRVREQSPDR